MHCSGSAHQLFQPNCLRAKKPDGGYATDDGKKVKQGLLRTASITQMSDADAQKLKDTYRVKAIMDFRSAEDIKQYPDPQIDGVTNVWLPILQEKPSDGKAPFYKNETLNAIQKYGGNMDAFFGYIYTAMVTDEYSIGMYQQFFDTLLETDGSMLWHWG